MARICIVTPSALGSNPRVVKEADALSQVGHSVHVVSTRSLDIVDRRDEDILARARWSSERIDLREPGTRMRLRVRRVLAEGLNRLTSAAAGDAFSPLATELTRLCLLHPADLYIAHYVAALPAAVRAAARHGAHYAFDAEDFHLGDLPDGPASAYQNGLIRRIEGQALPGCAYVTAASPGIAQAYARAYRIDPPTVVLNTFPRAEAPPGPTPQGPAEPRPSVYWVSQTTGPDRGLECAVTAISLAKSKPHLYLRGTLAIGFGETLKTLAARHGVAERLHLLEPEPPSRMTALAAGYDVGLAAEVGDTPNHEIALSNKQFTYLLAGLPTLMSDTPGHRAFAEEARGAVRLFTVGSALSLAQAMDDLFEDPTWLASARAEAFRLGQERFNWEVEGAKLLACVEGALGK